MINEEETTGTTPAAAEPVKTPVRQYARAIPKKYQKYPRIIDVEPDNHGLQVIRIKGTNVILRFACWRETNRGCPP